MERVQVTKHFENEVGIYKLVKEGQVPSFWYYAIRIPA